MIAYDIETVIETDNFLSFLQSLPILSSTTSLENLLLGLHFLHLHQTLFRFTIEIIHVNILYTSYKLSANSKINQPECLI